MRSKRKHDSKRNLSVHSKQSERSLSKKQSGVSIEQLSKKEIPQSQSPELRRVSSNNQISAKDKFVEYTQLALKTQTVIQDATKQISRNFKNFSDTGS